MAQKAIFYWQEFSLIIVSNQISPLAKLIFENPLSLLLLSCCAPHQQILVYSKCDGRKDNQRKLGDLSSVGLQHKGGSNSLLVNMVVHFHIWGMLCDIQIWCVCVCVCVLGTEGEGKKMTGGHCRIQKWYRERCVSSHKSDKTCSSHPFLNGEIEVQQPQ